MWAKVLILVASFACTFADETPEIPEIDNGVYVLTTKNFDDFLENNPFVFVEFYAPWCGHCKALAPKWENVADQIKEQEFGGKKVVLAKVDATVEAELASRFEIQGYPTLKWFSNGDISEYEGGGREEVDIIDFIQERADPNYEPPKSVVVVLTSENFTEFVDKHDISLVEFYAPWCGHCKRLAPDYERAARKLSDPKARKPIPLAKVDAAEEKDLATKYDVQGYPTLKIFRKGRVFDFKSKGTPNEQSIVSYMQGQAQPASRLIEDKKSFKHYADMAENDNDLMFVGFFESESDPLYLAYADATNELRDGVYKFTHVFGRELWKDFDISKPTITAFLPARFQTKYEPKRHEFSAPDASRSDVIEFIIANSIPLVGHFTHQTRENRYNNRRPLCLFFYTVDFSHEYRETTQKWRNKIASIANDFRDITFAIANDDELESVMREMGLEDSSEEMNVACYDAKGIKYPLDPPMEEWSDKHVRSWLNKMKKGHVAPFYRSQPIPAKGRDKDGKVTVVVGKTFNEIVMNSDKDALVFLHAPWCGHCKQFAPEYKKLAAKIIPKEGKNLVIAKIDATANDLPPSYIATGYPTIYFAPAGAKETPFKYDGNRQVDDLITFMKKHASKAFGTEKSEKKDEL